MGLESMCRQQLTHVDEISGSESDNDIAGEEEVFGGDKTNREKEK